MALIGNDVDGKESHHHVAIDITSLRSLRAGVDSRTVDKLRSALRADIRLRTLFKPDVMPKSNWSSSTIVKIREERE